MTPDARHEEGDALFVPFFVPARQAFPLDSQQLSLLDGRRQEGLSAPKKSSNVILDFCPIFGTTRPFRRL